MTKIVGFMDCFKGASLAILVNVCRLKWVCDSPNAMKKGTTTKEVKNMSNTNLMTTLLDSSPWQLGLWMTACGVGVLSWLLTLKVFVSYGEHNELKAYVAEHYIKRSEIKTHLNDLHQQLQSMQQQLNLMQQALYSALNK